MRAMVWAPGRPFGGLEECPHLARAAHPATGPPTKEPRDTLPGPSKKCVRAVRLMA